MSTITVLTGGLGNGTFTGTIADVIRQGLSAPAITEWYVRPSAAPGTYGDEDGSDYDNAFNGLANATLSDGHTLYPCGTFTGEQLTLDADNISVEKHPSYDAIINGADDGDTLIDCNDQSGWTIDGLTFGVCLRAINNPGFSQFTGGGRTVQNCNFNGCGRNAAGIGSCINFQTGNADGNGDTIQDNSFDDTINTAVKLGNDGAYASHDCLVTENTFYRCDYDNGDPSEGHVVDVAAGGDLCTISQNTFTECGYNGGEGNNLGEGGAAVSVDGATDCLITGNKFVQCWENCIDVSAQNTYVSTGHVIHSNLFIDCGFLNDLGAKNYKSSAIYVKNSLGSLQDLDLLIANNVFVRQKVPGAYTTNGCVIKVVTQEVGSEITGVELYNNDFQDCHDKALKEQIGAGAGAITVTDNKNNAQSSNTSDALGDLDTGTSEYDSDLDDQYRPTNIDLVGAGIAVAGVTTDYDGNAYSDPPTIGAFEMEGLLAVANYVIASIQAQLAVEASAQTQLAISADVEINQ